MSLTCSAVQVPVTSRVSALTVRVWTAHVTDTMDSTYGAGQLLDQGSTSMWSGADSAHTTACAMSSDCEGQIAT